MSDETNESMPPDGGFGPVDYGNATPESEPTPPREVDVDATLLRAEEDEDGLIGCVVLIPEVLHRPDVLSLTAQAFTGWRQRLWRKLRELDKENVLDRTPGSIANALKDDKSLEEGSGGLLRYLVHCAHNVRVDRDAPVFARKLAKVQRDAKARERVVDALAGAETKSADAIRAAVARLNRELDEETAQRVDPWSRKARLLPLEWLEAKPPDAPMLLRNEDGKEHLPLGKVGIVAARGGVGKTSFLAQLAVSVVTGARLLDTFDVPPEAQGGVFLALAEEDEGEVWRRLRKVVDALELSGEHRAKLHTHLMPVPLAGEDVRLVDDTGALVEPTETFDRLRRHLEQHTPKGGWRLIVLDPGVLFAGREAEKDNAAAAAFMNVLHRLTNLDGNPAVLMAHHTRKDDDGDVSAVRGSGALTDQARWVAQLVPESREDGERKVEAIRYQVTKTNYTRDRGERWFHFNGKGVLEKAPVTWVTPGKKADEEKAKEEKKTHFASRRR